MILKIKRQKVRISIDEPWELCRVFSSESMIGNIIDSEENKLLIELNISFKYKTINYKFCICTPRYYNEKIINGSELNNIPVNIVFVSENGKTIYEILKKKKTRYLAALGHISKCYT